MIHLERRSALFLLVLAVTGAGCIGQIGGQDGDAPNLPKDPQTSGDCTDLAVAPAPVRRLSRAEYLASVKDLFPTLDLSALAIGKDPTDLGFENRASLLNPTDLLIEQYNTAAADIAAKVIATPDAILPCKPADSTEADCAAKFVDAFGLKVFRRPLAADEKKTYVDFYSSERAAGADFLGGVQLVLETMLQSPQFLYRLEAGAPDAAKPGVSRLNGYEVATRMSFLLWGSGPDDALFAKAAADGLRSPEAREQEARRMLKDPRARGMMIEFHRQWLDLDRLSTEAKDTTTYPAYTPTLEAAMREESDRFVADVMWKGDGTLKSLLTSPRTEVNAELAAFYGVTAPQSGWAEVTLSATERAGFLTRANFLAARAHKEAGSPPLRAIFIDQRLLCQVPPKPPANADLSEPKPMKGGAKETNRQAFEDRLSPSACSGCHQTFTGLGYALENYDAIGKYRTLDNGLPVDAAAHFQAGDIDWQLQNGVDLSQKLADSADVQSCVASYWYEYAVGRKRDDSDKCRVEALGKALVDAKGDVREALVALVKNEDFVLRPTVKP